MTSYVRWIGRRCDTLEDRERATPLGYFGRTMAAHGEEHDAQSELGNGLVAIGQANERIAVFQETLAEQANGTWNSNLEQNAGMMKEYQVILSSWTAIDMMLTPAGRPQEAREQAPCLRCQYCQAGQG